MGDGRTLGASEEPLGGCLRPRDARSRRGRLHRWRGRPGRCRPPRRRPEGRACGWPSSPTTPRGRPTTSPRTSGTSGWRRRPTTWSPRPRRPRGSCATGSVRGPPWRCWAGAGSRRALRAESLVPVAVGDDAVALVSGYGPDVLWRDVMRAAVLVRDGLPWVASNTDLTIPTPYGTAPGHGVLVGLLSEFSDVQPVVAGKPERPLLDETIRRVGGSRPLMVGDRLDTDIDGADQRRLREPARDDRRDGPGPAGGRAAGRRPTYVAPDLGGLLEAHASPSVTDGVAEQGGWRAHADGARLIRRRGRHAGGLVAGGGGRGVGPSRRRRRARGHGRARASGGLS